mmetsp:Transcript_13862/g.24154  ORF Transcript_13862/g.24154 Transcript_13862/m.24154 type:complete len:116 (+) Transcript_13862:59-406(+)
MSSVRYNGPGPSVLELGGIGAGADRAPFTLVVGGEGKEKHFHGWYTVETNGVSVTLTRPPVRAATVAGADDSDADEEDTEEKTCKIILDPTTGNFQLTEDECNQSCGFFDATIES